ncbi:PREDICTED: sodium-coupled neutral amino acid transporter 9-like isoform X2 [Dinoponera quadriceps]|uniref:Sodium-coupled neutral amino acid transporter 9-like isoform X2 n=1 Tax=Dinoponera quadriceps TaxID=609295 RepID=A0A6P3YDZ4_DINQU|nr:PREDICTED: sodium-coupled neutral amino acid transporter 9-like isoform X2 [Dinoponera quadriceps]
MYKSHISRSSETPPRGNESESTSLLPSKSRTNLEPMVLFGDSETNDLNPADRYFKYGSADAASTTLMPKRPSSLTLDNELFVSVTADLGQEKNYNVDLILVSEKSDVNNYALERDFKTGSLQFQPDIVAVSHKDLKPKQNSLVTIFSIWNTILGSSLLTMPWGIAMAGFFPGIIIIFMMSGLCLYTAYRLIAAYEYHGGGENIEIIDLSRIYLNKWAEYIARIFSITVLMGATIAYWILMANFLYNSVNFIYDNIAGWSKYSVPENISHTEVLCPKKEVHSDNDTIIIYEKTFDALGPAWDLHATVPVFLGLLIFPLLNFNSTTFFTKFNSLGTVSVVYLIAFVIIKSTSWGVNMRGIEWETSWIIRPTFPALTGMLSMSFFIHNIIISIVKNNRNQKNNGRDLIIAYILVTVTYIILGLVFYICFPLPKSCIEDNLLNNFQKWDGLTIGVRIVLLFQLLTIYPLIAYMLRIQLISSICKTVCNRSLVLLINLLLVSICILFATFVPYVGTITRYNGALSGLIYVFTLPSLLHLSILKRQGKLTVCTLLIHLSIPVIGIFNLVAQFFITDK